MDVYVPFSTFKRILKDLQPKILFEGKSRVITCVAGLNVIAQKKSNAKVLDGYPMLGYGYASISTNDVKPVSREDLVEDAKEILRLLEKAEIDEVLEEIGYKEE